MTNEDKQLAILNIVEIHVDRATKSLEDMYKCIDRIQSLGKSSTALGNAFLELVPKMDRLQSLVNKGC